MCCCSSAWLYQNGLPATRSARASLSTMEPLVRFHVQGHHIAPAVYLAHFHLLRSVLTARKAFASLGPRLFASNPLAGGP